jgi:hypothetical protein
VVRVHSPAPIKTGAQDPVLISRPEVHPEDDFTSPRTARKELSN